MNSARAERSRESILAAASEEFVRHGYSGASVNKIAERALLNKRMLYHYFDSKEGLWLAVLEAAYERLRIGERALNLDDLEPDAAMQELVRFSYRHLIEHPDFIALLNIENLHRAEHLKRSTRIRRMHSPLVDQLRALLAAGREQGRFRRDVDATELYLSISSLCFFHLSNRYTLSVVFDRDIASPEALDARCEQIVGIVMAWLRSS